MKMEAPASNTLYSDDDTKNLELLLQTFGSVVSLQDIASAYCQAGRNVYMAGEILCNLPESTSGPSTSESKDDLNGASESSELPADTVLRKPHAERYSAPKPKKCSASAGTVSSVIGAEYARSRPSTHKACNVTKPLKLISNEFPVSEIQGVKGPSDNAEALHSGIEEFLFAMLGNGFQLGMNVIREVVGACGYDVEKSIDKLLDMSTSTLEMGDDVLSVTRKGKGKVLETPQCQEISLDRDSTASGEAGSRNGSELPLRGTDRYDLQKEVLQALFTVPDRFEEAPRRILPKKEVKRTRTFGKLVVEPLRDSTTECQFATAKLEVNKDENEDTEDGYEVLRNAVQEHWITMKEYYKAAADAYAKGDHTQAYKFLEKGHFFMDRAREANEKSAETLVETRDVEEIMSLDLHDHAPKEAIRLIKLHLTSLSGIPPIRYLKLTIGVNDGSTKEGTRKRLIKKLLERDSITWTEEGNGQIMVIQIDEINPKRLSFAKKPTVA